MPPSNLTEMRHGLLSRIIDIFLRGSLAPLLMVLSLMAGAAAIFLTPREEEPQIVVPMADVMVAAPGLSAQEVERQVVTPLEKLLFQIDGVEHIYSSAQADRAIVTVRFYVGEDRVASLVKIYNKIFSHTDIISPDVTSWVVKPVEIDDVPIVIATLWSDRPDSVDDYALRRIAGEVEIALQAIPETNRTQIVGGRPRVVRVEIDPDALSARRTAPLDVAFALNVSNVRRPTGSFDREDQHFTVKAGDFFTGVQDLKRAVVNVVDGTPVFLEDVARIIDGPEERLTYDWIGFGPADKAQEKSDARPGVLFPAVSIAIAKQKGPNAVSVSKQVKVRLAELSKTYFPAGVHYRITRDYGETARCLVPAFDGLGSL